MAEEKPDALDALIGDIIGDAQAEAAQKRQEEARQAAMREMQERRKANASKEEDRIREVGWKLMQKVAADLNAGGAKVEATNEPRRVGRNKRVHLGTLVFQKPENHKVPAARLAAWVNPDVPDDESPKVICEALVCDDVRQRRSADPLQRDSDPNYTTVGTAEGASEETLRELLRLALAGATSKEKSQVA